MSHHRTFAREIRAETGRPRAVRFQGTVAENEGHSKEKLGEIARVRAKIKRRRSNPSNCKAQNLKPIPIKKKSNLSGECQIKVRIFTQNG